MKFPCIRVSFFFFSFLRETFSPQNERKNKTNGSYGHVIIVEMQFMHKNKMFWFLSHSFVFFLCFFVLINNKQTLFFVCFIGFIHTKSTNKCFFYVVFSHHGYTRLFNSSFYVLSILFENVCQFFFSLVFGFPCDSIMSILHFTNI